MLRDFGFTLGPAVIGAVALSRAAASIKQQVAVNPVLHKAVAAFYASAAHAPAAQRAAIEAAIHAVQSGPLGANAVPASVTLAGGQSVPFNPLKDVAFDALSHSYSVGFMISGAAGLIAALLTVIAIHARSDETLLDVDLEALDE